MNKFEQEIINLLKKEKIAEPFLEKPKIPEQGDFAFPCFKAAKELKKNPKGLANELMQKLEKKIKFSELITKVHAVGPFLNFFVDKGAIAKISLNNIFREKKNYGRGNSKNKIMIEFSSPNTNKPLHLGHVRNCVIGEAVANILKFQGNNVTKACLVNDKGIHICKSMLAYKKWGKNNLPDIKPDYFVGKYYVMFGEKAQKEPELEKEAQLMLNQWEQGDKNIISLWKRMNSWVYEGFSETYKNISVGFDRMYYESKLYKEGREIILEGLKRGIFQKDGTGAIIADLEKYDLPKKVLIRGDGTTLYITQDIYLAKLKVDEYKLDESIYVVASEQNLHFRILFKILNLLGYKWAGKCRHLSYGMVYLPEGKMKSREGKIVEADDLIREMKELARFQIKERHKDIDEKHLLKRETQIGLGALKFYLIKTDFVRDMYYNPEESISFEGETGPYLQYTHARICSILRKFKEEKLKINSFIKKIKYDVYDEKENEIIKMLDEFPIIAKDAAEQLKPSIITRYLLDLSQKLNEFYHASPILKAPSPLMEARILLIYCAKEVLEIGLNLLGIEAPEEM